MSNSNLQPLLCCVGDPVAGNPTQFMMERAFAAAGLDWRWLTVEVPAEDLPAAIAGMRAMRFSGIRFLPPHQAAATYHVDQVDDEATWVGAITTAYRRQGIWHGTHSLIAAVAKLTGSGSLGSSATPESEKPGREGRIVLVGSSLECRAALAGVAGHRLAELQIFSDTIAHSEKMVEELSPHLGLLAIEAVGLKKFAFPENVRYLIVGQESQGALRTLDFPDSSAQRGDFEQPILIDLSMISSLPEVYSTAKAAGWKVISGSDLAIEQAVADTLLWTQQAIDPQVLRDAIEEYFEL